jgi:ketosteroid isomerase-like protein
MSNIETVSAIYQAFSTGNVGAILERLAPEVRWDDRPHHGIPLLALRRTPTEVLGRFEVKQLFEGGAQVVAHCAVEFTWKPTGRRFADDRELHIWEFDPQGRVVAFTHVVDTYAMHQAVVG